MSIKYYLTKCKKTTLILQFIQRQTEVGLLLSTCYIEIRPQKMFYFIGVNFKLF